MAWKQQFSSTVTGKVTSSLLNLRVETKRGPAVRYSSNTTTMDTHTDSQTGSGVSTTTPLWSCHLPETDAALFSAAD